MAKINEATLTCNKCGHEFPIDVYESVNVTLDKDLKEKVISKKIFEFICPECGEFHRVIYPFLYVDMEKMFMVYLADKDTNLNDLRDQTIIQATDFLHNYKCRAVTDMHELAEKIIIQECELNDKVIEILKLFAVTQSNLNRENLRNAYFVGKDDQGLHIDLVLKDNTVTRAIIPMMGYDNCYTLNKDFFDEEKDEWEQLDVYWALNFVDSQMGATNAE